MGSSDIKPRVRWVHTGIQAPYAFTVTGFNQLETGRGVAYSARLVHPDLGIVGLISNGGRGGPTTFHAEDRARFGERELERFLQNSVQDGKPMTTGYSGLEHLLDEIINEAETAEAVAGMRLHSQFLVRSYVPREAVSWGPVRGAPLAYTRIVARRSDRERLATTLITDPPEHLHEGGYWQMFTGEDWISMPGACSPTPEQIADRVRRIDRLAAELDLPQSHHTAVPLEEFFLFGTPTARFTLVGDRVRTIDSTRWCRCPRRQRVVAFERWKSQSLEESGTVHAAVRCRRLVRID